MQIDAEAVKKERMQVPVDIVSMLYCLLFLTTHQQFVQGTPRFVYTGAQPASLFSHAGTVHTTFPPLI